jgi:hypothetical protein
MTKIWHFHYPELSGNGRTVPSNGSLEGGTLTSVQKEERMLAEGSLGTSSNY